MQTKMKVKNQAVLKFVDCLKENKKSWKDPSECQVKLFDNMVEMLEIAAPILTMSDARRLIPFVENLMEADGGESTTYQTIFKSIYQDLQSCVDEERRASKIKVNQYLTEATRPYFEKARKANLMDDNYQWTEIATSGQKALWIDLLSNKFGIEDRWVWAKNEWGLINIKQKLTYEFRNSNNEKCQVVRTMFDILE